MSNITSALNGLDALRAQEDRLKDDICAELTSMASTQHIPGVRASGPNWTVVSSSSVLGNKMCWGAQQYMPQKQYAALAEGVRRRNAENVRSWLKTVCARGWVGKEYAGARQRTLHPAVIARLQALLA